MSVRFPPPLALLGAGLVWLGAGAANAIPCDEACTVSVGKASLTYDGKDDDPNDTLLSGLEDWTVKGVTQLFQQVFAVRVGAGPTTNVGNLTFLSADASGDTITADYETAGGLLRIGLSMTLSFGGGSTSGIDETITVTPQAGLTDTPISIFLYTDLDLAGDDIGDTGTSTADTLTQSDGAAKATVATTTATSGFELDDSFPLLLNAIIDGTLGDTPLGGTTGPLSGDINHVFQWTFDLDADDPAFTIGTGAAIDVPAPATLGLIGVGLIAIGMLGRRARG